MRRLILLTLSLALLGPAGAQQWEEQPTEPSEELKREALLLGYQLNGNSMVRWGSIDLVSIIHPLKPPASMFPPQVRQSGGPR